MKLTDSDKYFNYLRMSSENFVSGDSMVTISYAFRIGTSTCEIGINIFLTTRAVTVLFFLALCDASYKFTLVDIGAEGRHSDGGIFRNSDIGKMLSSENNLHLPSPSFLEYGGDAINYYIAADEAFPLTLNIMRPYPGRYLAQDKRIFNYRLSRGRRVIENTFGILAARWRIYRKPIISSLSTADGIIKATVCLHNWLMIYESKIKSEYRHYCPSNFIDREKDDGAINEGDWRKETNGANLCHINRMGANMYGKNAFTMREQIKSYFFV
ncbi:hypothetical protein NQ317_000584 [Molorchus minor]|uniref:DDE Tnp4 domain-containing protein n=1 Tax=Molorchus minor TaxID=1323400 RepID=A0ABQ9IWT5_9CUCU|nr:hypothetical protein NQ317_000584 [Molorchus minor]